MKHITKPCLVLLTFGYLTAVLTGCQKDDIYETRITTVVPASQPVTVETNVQIDPEERESSSDYLDQLVSAAILEQNADSYLSDECPAEGHMILEEQEQDGILTLYALTMYGEYAFHNVDYFVKSSGTGAIPTVMKFDLRLNSHTPLISIERPEDGSGYIESIKTIFPEHLWDRVITIQEDDANTLTAMEQEYAKQYLVKLGRDALIGNYADFEHTLLTDLGISVEVSNHLLEYEKDMGPYPNWHGSTEKIEYGVRYMYSVFYDEETSQIIYEKRVFDSMETVEKFVFDAETGEKQFQMKHGAVNLPHSLS